MGVLFLGVGPGRLARLAEMPIGCDPIGGLYVVATSGFAFVVIAANNCFAHLSCGSKLVNCRERQAQYPAATISRAK